MLTWGGALLWPFLGLPLASAALGKWARNHIKQEADNFYGKD